MKSLFNGVWLVVLGVLWLMPLSALADTRYQARKALYAWYHDKPVSFYCQCRFTWKNPHRAPAVTAKNCPFKGAKGTRSQRIEWEHVVPVSVLAKGLSCWREGGRSDCQSDQDYRALAHDPINLVPAIGSINARRSNSAFAELPRQHAEPGWCSMKFSKGIKRVEPPVATKGAIARIYLYMAQRHGLILPPEQRRLLQRWAKKYPASATELARFKSLGRRRALASVTGR